MPFNELQRRDSWPPTIVRFRDEESNESDAIDENPFAFFLTSPEDDDEFFDEDLSAGIETPESSPSPVREISPSSLQRDPLPDDDVEEDYQFGLAMPLSLKDFSLKHTSARKAHKEAEKRHADEYLMKGLGITLPNHISKPAVRGRATIRLVPTRGARGRGQTRSLSARRPQSWREPSPEIFSIKEERESDDGVKVEDADKENEMPISASAPSSTRIGVGGMATVSPVPIPKPKKRVHWAL